MHPSNPSSEPALFTRPASEAHVQDTVGVHGPDSASAAAGRLPRVEEIEEPERWDGLS